LHKTRPIKFPVHNQSCSSGDAALTRTADISN